MRFPRFPPFAAGSVVIHVAIGAALVRGVPAVTPPAPTDPAPALAGETFDVSDPGDNGGASDLGDLEPSASPAPDPTPESTPTPTQRPTSYGNRAGRRAKGNTATAAASSPGDPGSPNAGTFGAVGERGAADLVSAFTRGFPQAASADPVWQSVPFGAAGEADLTLTIDDSGRLVGTTISPSTPAPLRAGISRTIALIRARAFTARGARTKIHLSAQVSPDQVHDGLHGDVFALGGSVTGAQGSAFFALAIGRRVDLRISVR